MRNSKTYAAGLMIMVALLAGCAAPPGGDGDATLMGSATIAPGNKAGVPLILEDTEWEADSTTLVVADDDGLNVEVPDRMTSGQDGALVAWVTFDVADDAPTGDRDVVVTVTNGDGDQVNAAFAVTVETPDPPLAEGQTVLLILTLRTMAGEIAFSNDAEAIDSALPPAPGADPPTENPEPIPFPLSPNPQLPAELLDAVLAGGVGHNVQAEAAEAYGPAQTERQEPRNESLPRENTEQRSHEIDRATAAQQGFVTEESQEGDPVDVGSALPYVITHLNETMVTIALDVDESGTYTLYDAWPESTEVVEMTEESVTFRTTPSTAEGETFTWRPEWPDATTIASMDDENIELRHTPEIGTTYTTQTQQGGETQATVQEVGDEQITIVEANPHPLAGQTLYFELTIDGLQEEQQQQPPSGMQPGP